jgi:2,5-diketo-D-gluconate reductase A
MSAIPEIMLNNGRSIPQFGFGVFQIEPDDTAEAVTMALQAGYRHIDTAQMYGNEKQVGGAIAQSGLDRAEIFVTTKLSNASHLPDDARRAFAGSLDALGVDYVDLFLIHWPLPTRYDGDYVSTWKALEEFYRDGRARSIGVSNFQPHHLRRLHGETEVPPAVNQIEVHPYLTQDDVRQFCAGHQIAIEAWSPIAQGQVLDDPTIVEIAGRAGQTPAQVVLRWHIERGDIIFPKSVTAARIKENIDIFGWELSGEDVEAISALNRNERTGPDPDKFDLIPS